MKLTIFAVLVFGHLVVASNEPPNSSAKEVIGDIMSAISGAFDASSHIVGGREAVPHGHPHQVALISTHKDSVYAFACGGSLIAPEWILTAAHCVINVTKTTAYLGAHDLRYYEKERQKIRVKKIIQDDWDPTTLARDIALAKLAKPAIINEYVKPIRLPSKAARTKTLWRTPIEITGWGRFSDNNNASSPYLRSAQTKVLANKYCNLLLGGAITPKMLCADNSQGKSTCNGDSGGPMVMKESDGEKTLIGVTSFGKGLGCQKGFPSAFTRVDQYLGWIHRNTDIPIREN